LGSNESDCVVVFDEELEDELEEELEVELDEELDEELEVELEVSESSDTCCFLSQCLQSLSVHWSWKCFPLLLQTIGVLGFSDSITDLISRWHFWINFSVYSEDDETADCEFFPRLVFLSVIIN
jgi:hypothetical protein